jgi:hypothetical protein
MKPAEQEILVVKKGTFKREYDFLLNDRVIANLNCVKGFGRKAVVKIGNKEWTFVKKGFWKQTIEIQAGQSPYEKKKFELDWRHRGKFEGPDGKLYQLRQTNCWKSIWSWQDENKNSLGDLKSNALSSKKRGTIRFSQPLKDELLCMFVLGWFMLTGYEETAAVVAAAS